tara:strand:- start:6480 stop:7427 length:948 start_codon:yes stop_codon:yes gene_type:complete
MKKFDQLAYYVSISHLYRWKTLRTNELISNLHTKNMSLSEFFENIDDKDFCDDFNLKTNEVADLQKAKKDIPNNSFLVEDLLDQGFDIIPITSDRYPNNLKVNLKKRYSPPILYTKGDLSMLNEEKIAIVGSRDANEISIKFTKNIARNAVENSQVIVSGFAKGTDRMALDSALDNKGKSIIVLPQGIKTFSTGFKKYYSQIIEGDVLVLSTFHPNVPWSVGLAMARNTYIYGLANAIYVSQSANKGGTWSGVVNGLKRDREIYVRMSKENEDNANNQLISKGAIPIDIEGNVMELKESKDSKKSQVKVKQIEIF